MKKHDVKLGPTWTDEGHRRQGLAIFSVCTLAQSLGNSSRDFWWFCEKENLASQRLACKLGFDEVGTGILRKRLGLRLFSAYIIADRRVPE